MKTYKLEAPTVVLEGKYWVGDPCYIFPDKEWQDLCNQMFPNFGDADFNDRNNVRVVEVEGFTCYLFGTASGDGCYPFINKNNFDTAELGVDAGMLSLIPVKLVNKKGWGKSKQHGKVTTLFGKKGVMKVKNGNFSYCGISIKTDF